MHAAHIKGEKITAEKCF